MKKYNLYLWLAALVGLFASCSQDENAMLQTNESNRVSLTAELPDDFAQIGTRSVPDAPGGYKLRCILEVWSKDLNTLKVRQEAAPGGTEDITFNFTLQETGEYKALLWADYILSGNNATPTTIANLSDVQHFADEYYTTNSGTGLQAVARKKGEMTNPDCLDAFFAYQTFTKKATALDNLSARLIRPLTKLTIAEKNSTNNFDYCETVKATAIIPTQINVATGDVSASQKIVMWDAAPSGTNITVSGSACKTLFSTYILATTDGTMQNIELELTATEGTGKILKNVTIPAGVPAKRNYRVNAAGNLILAEDEPSDDAKMTVEIKADWATVDTEKDEEKDVDPKVGDYYYKDGTWSAEIKNNPDNPIIGVVNKVYSPTSSTDQERYGKARGKVISLKEETSQWATENVAAGTNVAKGGKENTDHIIQTYVNSLNDYPIFKACNDLRTETGKDWYIPIGAEYTLDIFRPSNNFNIVNSKIEAAEGVQVVIPTGNDNAYWTCTEPNEYSGSAVIGENMSQSLRKTESHKVRFILEF